MQEGNRGTTTLFTFLGSGVGNLLGLWQSRCGFGLAADPSCGNLPQVGFLLERRPPLFKRRMGGKQ